MIKLHENEWITFIKLKVKPELLDSAIEQLKEDLRFQGYLNDKNEIVLNKEKTLVKFYEEFKNRFTNQIKDYVLRKVEEEWLRSKKIFGVNT